MNSLTQTRPVQETPAATPRRADAKVVLVATAVAVVVWVAAKAAGVDLEVRSGSGTTQVALGSVVVTPIVVGFVAAALLRLLEPRTKSGLRTWTVVAVVAWRCRSSDRCRPPAWRPAWRWRRCTSLSVPWWWVGSGSPA
jgi:hypothetical protein